MRPSTWKCVAAGAVALLAACGDITGSAGDPVALRRAQGRWNAQDIDDYRMTIRRRGGMIAAAAIITVRDGEPVSVQPIAPSEEMPASAFQHFDTVEELFGILESAHGNGADRIDAEYHPQLGVPMDVYIDPQRNAVDEEHGFVVELFEPL